MDRFWTSLLAVAVLTAGCAVIIVGLAATAQATDVKRTECVGIVLPVEHLDADPDAASALLGSSSRTIPAGWQVVAGGGLSGGSTPVVSAVICRERMSP